MTDARDAEAPAGDQLHETALIDIHRALGARLIEFGGWLMPVQYAGILEEHRAVRERAGLFDLSHMGELFVEGDDAGDALAAALISDPRTLAVGRAQYSMICAPDGGIIDDLIVYRLGEERFLVVANASNAPVVSEELARATRRLAGRPRRPVAGHLARRHPGPAAPRGSSPRSPTSTWPRSATTRSREGHVAGIPALVARTGLHGRGRLRGVRRLGARTRDLGARLPTAGEAAASSPCGLGARDTLRLEAGMPLYGNELDRDDQPVRGRPRPRGQARRSRATSSAATALERVARDGPDKRSSACRSRAAASRATATRSDAGDRRDRAS